MQSLVTDIKFRKAFEKYKVDEDTILIGHSCGSAFLVHWLGDTKQAVKLILVAPWKIADRMKYRREFYKYPIDRTIRIELELLCCLLPIMRV